MKRLLVVLLLLTACSDDASGPAPVTDAAPAQTETETETETGVVHKSPTCGEAGFRCVKRELCQDLGPNSETGCTDGTVCCVRAYSDAGGDGQP